MSDFSVSTLPQSAILYLYSIRDSIWLDPPYQRASDIWTIDKRQLLMDSVLNGYDIPKIYLHELVPARKAKKSVQKYAIVDGKQRLDALWGFINGDFALAEDFEYMHDADVRAAGLTYTDLGLKYPALKTRFDSTSLAVVSVRTDDVELIEDMFSRLNEAVPLNAPEKRNAFPGPLPKAIRELAEHKFFKVKLPFTDRRFKHRDLAAKYLMIEAKDEIADTKKAYLDEFVKSWAEKPQKEATDLTKSAATHLDRMAKVFTDEDPLLRSVGMSILVFHLFRLLDKTGTVAKIRRDYFAKFEDRREQNRGLAENDIAKAAYDLLEFDKYVQTPNDAYAVRLRLTIISKFFRQSLGFPLPKSHPYLDADR
jgi:hypothetical protein